MKQLLFAALALSVVANVVLLADLLRRSKLPNSGADGAATVSPHRSPAAASPAGLTPPASVTTASAGRHLTAWQLLHDRDPARFAANLAAAGFPRAAQRGAVYALLRDLQTPERQRALDQVPQLPFWQAATDRSAQIATNREINRLWQEREQTMRRLFPEEQEAYLLQARAQFGPLPEETLEKLRSLERDYLDMRISIQSPSAVGLSMPWHAEEQAVLNQEKRRDVVAMLTPKELEEYDLRSSPTANSLRRNLTDFNPTEQEFRAMYAAQSRVDALRQGGFDISSEGMNTRRQAQQDANKALQDALGPARYAEYQRATDRGYQAAFAVTQNRNLPVENARAAYQVQRDIQQRAAEYRRLPPAQRAEQLAALAAEAEKSLATLLTPEGLADYRRSGGFWLRNLVPPTPPSG